MSALIKTACLAACLIMATFLSVASANAITVSGNYECFEYDNPPSPDDDGDPYLTSPINLTFFVTHVSCNGAKDGAVTVIAADNGNYDTEVIWSTGETTPGIYNLEPGVYTVVASDSAGNQTQGSVVIRDADELGAEVELESVCSESITLDIYGNTGAQMAIVGYPGQYFYSYDGENYTPLEEHVEKERVTGDEENIYGDIELLDNGSMYVAFYETHKFGDVQLDANFNSYLVKVDRNNEIEWYEGIVEGSRVQTAIDEDGNVYWAFEGLSPRTETIGGVSVSIAGATLVKLSPSGDYLWHKSLSQDLYTLGVSTDLYGNVYLATNNSIYKYDKLGAEQWQKEFTYSGGVNPDEYSMQLAVGGTGEVYVAFGSGNSFSIGEHSFGGNFSLGLASFNTDGDLQWMKVGNGNSVGTYLGGLSWTAVGNLVVALDIRDSTFAYEGYTFNNFYANAILHIDASGGGVTDVFPLYIYDDPDELGFNQVTNLTTDENANIYVSGERAYGSNRGHYIKGFDFTGETILNETSDDFYFIYRPMPIAASRNGVVWANYWSDVPGERKMQITEFGPESKVTIPYSGQSEIYVKNKLGCELRLDINANEYEPLPICYISQTNSNNVIHWSDDVEGTVDIFKETTAYGEFEYVATSSAGLNYWQDVNSNANIRSYRYKIKPSDQCEAQDFSGAHKTLHLTANLSSRGETNLVWDKYEGLEYKSFLIYSGYNPQNMEFVTEIPANLFTYTADYSVRGPYFQIAIEADLDCEVGGSASGARVAQGESNLIKSNIINTLEVDALQLFPVPAKEYVNVMFKEDGSDYQLKMFDVKGAVRYQATVDEAVQIPVNSLTPGLYTISLINASGKAESRHIVVE